MSRLPCIETSDLRLSRGVQEGGCSSRPRRRRSKRAGVRFSMETAFSTQACVRNRMRSCKTEEKKGRVVEREKRRRKNKKSQKGEISRKGRSN